MIEVNNELNSYSENNLLICDRTAEADGYLTGVGHHCDARRIEVIFSEHY
jgi:hypothetical protein